MILAISTSSPIASVAAFDASGVCIWSQTEEAPRAAGKACMEMLEAWGRLSEVQRLVADVGPGSFTGVRVGVTLTKTIAWALGCDVAGITSFELIGEAVVAIPARKGEWMVRREGITTLERSFPIDAAGCGAGVENPTYPLAKAVNLENLTWMKPEALLPEYLMEPSISKPNIAYSPGAISG